VEIRQVLEHKHLGNGSIILFHNDAKYTPKVLDTILKGIKEKGFEIVPISQLIHRENFEMDHEGRQIPVKMYKISLNTREVINNRRIPILYF